MDAEVNVHSRESNVGARSDLKQLLASAGPLPVAQAAELMLRVCEALAHVHASGTVHGSLSPTKIAIAINDDDTMDVAVIGSDPESPGMSDDDAWSYMAPEQLRGNDAPVNARADLWAVGAILHELLSGERVFSAPTREELASKIESQQPTPLRNLRRDVPPGMDTLVLYCLEKNPEGRPPSVGHVASALGRFVPTDARGAVARIHSILRQHRPSSDPHSSDLAMARSRPSAIVTPLGSLFPPSSSVWRQRAKLGAAGVAFVVTCGLIGHSLRREPAPAVSRTVSANAAAVAAPASPIEMIVEEDAIQVLRPDELPAAPVVDVSALPAKPQRTGEVAPAQTAPVAAAPSEPIASAEPAGSAPGVAPEAVELTEDEGASGGEFDAAAAKASIASAAARVSACHDGTSAPQKALVTITFAVSGEASAVSVAGALAGTSTAACVEQLFRGVTVPAFTGDSVTVSRTVSVGN